MRATTAPDFGERYAVVRQLGDGGMGIVYEALDRERDMRVALKAIHRANAATLYRLKQEFRAIADVSHPNLVTLYDLFAENDRAFFTMELVQGHTFLEHVRTATCNLSKLRTALRQLVSAVSALHDAGKLHRDIKPSNVLVTREGRVVLLDFGIATDLEPKPLATAGDRVLGTLEYMSPEQASSAKLSEASDFYSVGVMLHEALTGRVPISGPFVQLLKDKQQLVPPPPSTLADVPEDLDALCQALLEHDPKKRPTGAQILRCLGSDVGTAVHSTRMAGTGGVPFVGRDVHLEKLRSAFVQSRDGRAVVMHVRGRSGMGKSALVQRFTGELGEQALVLSGRCYERESVPFKALDSLIDGLTRHLRSLPSAEVGELLPTNVLTLARVFPVLARVEDVVALPRRRVAIPDPQEIRRKAFSAFRDFAQRLTQRQPLVLWVDDLQWGDVDSAALLAELLRPPHPPPVLLILSYRAEEPTASPFLKALADRQFFDPTATSTDEIEVGPLSPNDAAHLATFFLGSRDAATEERAAQIARESRGNPYFVDELVRHVRNGDELDGEVPVRLDDALHRRIRSLPEEAASLLRVVAIAGGIVEETVVLRTAELSAESARASLARLHLEHLVRSVRAGTALDTFHDRVRETVLAHLDAATEKCLHERIAVALRAAGTAEPDVLLEHYHACGDREREAEFALVAAENAMETLAFGRAVVLYTRVLDMGGHSASEQRATRYKRVEALTNACRWADAAEERLALAENANPTETLQLRTLAAEQLLCSGRFDRGAAILGDVLRAVHVFVPNSPWTTVVALLLARLALVMRGLRFRPREGALSPTEVARIEPLIAAGHGFGMSDNVLGSYFGTRALLRCLAAGDTYRLARTLAAEACFSSTGGHKARARTLDLLRRLRGFVDALGTPVAKALLAGATGYFHFFMLELPSAKRELQRAERIFGEQCVGQFYWQTSAQTLAFRTMVFMGERAELVERLASALREMERAGDISGLSNQKTGALAWLRLTDDQVSVAQEELRDLAELLPKSRFVIQNYFHWQARTQLALYCGQAKVAFDEVERALSPLRRSLLLRVSSMRILAWELRGRATLASAMDLDGAARDERLRAVESIARRLGKERYAASDGYAALLRAGMNALRGRTEDTLRCAQEAEIAFAKVSMNFHGAAARWCQGVHMGGDEGVARVGQARKVFLAESVAKPEKFVKMLAPAATEHYCRNFVPGCAFPLRGNQ